MALPSAPNKVIPSSTRKGDSGWPVFALQCGLDTLGYSLDADGSFGPATDEAVRHFQKDNKLIVDGIAGSASQQRVTLLIDARTHERHRELPVGLLRGFAETEGGNNLGAVNWNIAGGVDCGVVQIRVYGPPYDRTAMMNAFDPGKAMERVALTFKGRVDSNRSLPYAKRQSLEFSQRCAALSWNWPYAAEQYAKYGKLPSPSQNATWAVIQGQRVKFPDGSPVMTWKDWAEFYALGGKHGEGRVTRFVDW
jgi:peptidoglycan hydrolase-like protein with peptidoglycan-binding domain